MATTATVLPGCRNPETTFAPVTHVSMSKSPWNDRLSQSSDRTHYTVTRLHEYAQVTRRPVACTSLPQPATSAPCEPQQRPTVAALCLCCSPPTKYSSKCTRPCGTQSYCMICPQTKQLQQLGCPHRRAHLELSATQPRRCLTPVTAGQFRVASCMGMVSINPSHTDTQQHHEVNNSVRLYR